jgi:hypothetical protein
LAKWGGSNDVSSASAISQPLIDRAWLSHTSHKLQPCDVGVFGPLKMAYREEVEKLYRGGSDAIGKQHFTLLYDRARQKAFSQRNILSGWSKAGLRPFNPQKVLDGIQKPVVNSSSTTLTAPKTIHDVKGAQLPDTPVTADALSALRRRIENTVAKTESMKPDEKLCIDKLMNAAENAFAERSILPTTSRRFHPVRCQGLPYF